MISWKKFLKEHEAIYFKCCKKSNCFMAPGLAGWLRAKVIASGVE